MWFRLLSLRTIFCANACSWYDSTFFVLFMKCTVVVILLCCFYTLLTFILNTVDCGIHFLSFSSVSSTSNKAIRGKPPFTLIFQQRKIQENRADKNRGVLFPYQIQNHINSTLQSKYSGVTFKYRGVRYFLRTFIVW